MEPEQINESKYPWYRYKRTKFDDRIRSFGKFLSATILIIAALIIISNEFLSASDIFSLDESSSAATEETGSDADCNVVGIELHGNVVTYISPGDLDADGNNTVDQTASENVLYMINEAEKDEKTKAILLEVDSFGGSGVAGEEIAQALKSAKKPTVALIRGAGDSAAYWAATGAGIIFASKNSDVGSIGVTYSYLDAVEQNKKEGLTYNLLSAGKFKDTGDPDKPLSAEEVKLIMRDVNIMHQNFIKDVSNNRKLGLENVTSLADGSTMLGEAALKNGLIDQIGGTAEVKQYLKEKIGAEPEICW